MDYKKAFDLINHELLIAKRKAIGVNEDYLTLSIDYMRDRKQYVNIDRYHSSTRSINLGVPQGCVLGPVLNLHLFVTPLRTYMLMIPPLVMPRTIRLRHKMLMMVSSLTWI